MTRRVAVYGGSFNPFGNNHLDVLRYVAESGEFNGIVVVPSAAHALKANPFPFEHRYNMALLGNQAAEYAKPSFPERVWYSVSMAELHMLRDQRGPIYTIDLLRYLKKTTVGTTPSELKFVVGPDIIEELDRWKYVDEIRNEFGFFEVPGMGVHASQVRNMMASGVATWTNHVPSLVARYIRKHGLYNVQRVDCQHNFQDTPPDRTSGTTVQHCPKCGLERVFHLENHA